MSGLPVFALAAPLALLLACLSGAGRHRVASLLVWAPLPALLAAMLSGFAPAEPVVLPPGLFRITLILDGRAALLLGPAALLWSLAGAAIADSAKGRADSFAVWWLLTLTGSLAVFMAADLVSFYLAFALVSLPATGLVAFDATPQSRRAAGLYLGLALVGEAFLLLGFVLLAQGAPGLLIRETVAALPAAAAPNAAIALLIAGFGVKIGLVPLHVWMPRTYTATPYPAAAALSGAAVKAGVIGLLRFLPFDAAWPGWGSVLVGVGFVSAFGGVAVGLTQANPKTILAYSSISQMGLIAAVLGLGLAAGHPGIALPVAFYAAHHVLVKGGLFLAVGLAGRMAPPRRFWIVLLPAALVGLSLAGLPLTGGAIAKLAIKGPLGAGLVGWLGALSAAGTALLMLHFIGRLVAIVPENAAVRIRTWPWLLAGGAALIGPWRLYAPLGLGHVTEVLSGAALWSALWPILLGAALAAWIGQRRGALPELPAGDIVVLLDRAVAAAPRLGAVVERLDGSLRQWPVAGVALLAIVLALGAAFLAGG